MKFVANKNAIYVHMRYPFHIDISAKSLKIHLYAEAEISVD